MPGQAILETRLDTKMRPIQLLLLLASAMNLTAQWDLRSDWSEVGNPFGNGNCWRLEKVAGPFAVHQTSWVNWPVRNTLQPAWSDTGVGFGHVPAWLKVATGNAAGDFQAGDVGVHSDDSFNGQGVAPTTVRWTCPVAGTYRFRGSLWLLRLGVDRPQAWRLVASVGSSDTTLLNGTLLDSGPERRSAPSAFDLPIALAAGDSVRLEFVTQHTFGWFTGVDFSVYAATTPGAFATFGTGCGPTHYLIGHPIAGKTMSLSMGSCPPGQTAILFLGFGPTAIDLTALGMPGCTAYLSPLDSRLTLTNGPGLAPFDGTAALDVAIPNSTTLLGVALLSQYAVFAPGANALNLLLSPGGRSTIGG